MNSLLALAVGLPFIVPVLFFLSLTACQRHVPVAEKYGVVQRSTYAYQRQDDGRFVVAATDGQALKDALKEIGCGNTMICMVQRDGDLFTVDQRKIR